MHKQPGHLMADNLAYSDDAGIWMWDVYTIDSQPELLIANDSNSTLIPNYFSPVGRYLNFSRDVVRKHLDIVSGEILPDGLISPDDKILINYENQSGAFGYAICALDTNICKNGWEMFLPIYDETLGKIIKAYTPNAIHKVLWKDKFSFLQLACVKDEPEVCAVFSYTTTFDGWYSSPIGQGIDFVYDSKVGTTAILRDAHTITIKGIEIDTSQWFDEEIIGIEWLPSLFYYDD